MNDKNRCDEYIDSYKLIYDMKHLFLSITIIETISKVKIDYLENSGLNVFYSKLDNPSSNKGTNWLNHVSNFLSNSELNDDDIIIFITGRYKIISAMLSEELAKQIDKEILQGISNLGKNNIRKIKIDNILKSFE
jgi:hypothetical protein